MPEDVVEREFMGKGRSRIWTYLILMLLMVAVVIVINVVWNDPTRAANGIKSFMGLPAWALALVTFIVGAVLYWAGLKMETDWPEGIGAFLISVSVAWAEIIIGWRHFELGLVVVPYVLPVAVFGFLLIYAMKKSV
jgi:hypothetical protein